MRQAAYGNGTIHIGRARRIVDDPRCNELKIGSNLRPASVSADSMRGGISGKTVRTTNLSAFLWDLAVLP